MLFNNTFIKRSIRIAVYRRSDSIPTWPLIRLWARITAPATCSPGRRPPPSRARRPRSRKARPATPSPVPAVKWVPYKHTSTLCALLTVRSLYLSLLVVAAFSGNSSPLNTSASDRHKPTVEEALNSLTSEMVSSTRIRWDSHTHNHTQHTTTTTSHNQQPHQVTHQQ